MSGGPAAARRVQSFRDFGEIRGPPSKTSTNSATPAIQCRGKPNQHPEGGRGSPSLQVADESLVGSGPFGQLPLCHPTASRSSCNRAPKISPSGVGQRFRRGGFDT